MKITLDAQLLFEKEKTGIGIMTKEIIERMVQHSDNDISLSYFTFRKNELAEQIMNEYRSQGCKITQCQWLPLFVYRRIWNIIPLPYSKLVHEQSDFVQFFNYDVPPGVSGKALVYVHDMTYKAHPEMMNKRTKRNLDKNLVKSCKRAAAIITVSEFSKQQIMKYLKIPSEKIHVVPCGVDIQKYQIDIKVTEIESIKSEYKISGEYLLYLGTLEPRKNIEGLIEGYALAYKKNSELPKLVLTGKKGWSYESIFEKVQELNIEEQVIFTGYVRDQDKLGLIKGAKAFVFVPFYEGFGIPPIEAMASGTPVLVSDVQPISEIVGDDVIKVDPNSKEAIAEGMEKILSEEYQSQEYRQKLIQQAGNYSWENSVNKLLSVYELLNKGAKE